MLVSCQTIFGTNLLDVIDFFKIYNVFIATIFLHNSNFVIIFKFKSNR